MTDPDAKGHSKVKDVLTFANIELGSDGDDILTWNIDIKVRWGFACSLCRHTYPHLFLLIRLRP